MLFSVIVIFLIVLIVYYYKELQSKKTGEMGCKIDFYAFTLPRNLCFHSAVLAALENKRGRAGPYGPIQNYIQYIGHMGVKVRHIPHPLTRKRI